VIPPIIIGGGGGDGGGDIGTARDGSLDATVAFAVTGRVIIAQTLPLTSDMSATRGAPSWNVLSLFDPTAAPATTNFDGNFTLDRVSLMSGAMLLRAAGPSSASAWRALAFRLPSSTAHTIVTVSDTVMQSAGMSAGVVPDAAFAQVIVQLVDTPTTVAGITAQLVGVRTAPPAYDTGRSTLSAAMTATGSLGTAVFFNVPPPAVGTYAVLRLTRGVTGTADAGRSAEYSVALEAGSVTWITASPP